jgi:PPOX class probable FMN-dependent enzyme
MFRNVVTDLDELRALMGEPSELAIKKDIGVIDEHMRAFIAHAPFALLATASAAGACDVSPKGDAPGFVRVLDERHLVVPDRPGNRRLDGMRNILENPHAGLLFLIPGKEETLRINGRAWIVRDEEILESLMAMGKRPTLAIGIEVQQCFLHCAKAFKRSHLWEPSQWPALDGLASAARMFLDQAKPAHFTLEDMERRLQEGYTRRLY